VYPPLSIRPETVLYGEHPVPRIELKATNAKYQIMKKNSLLVTALALLILLGAANTVQAVEIVKSIPLNMGTTMAYDSYKGAVWVTTYYSYVNEMGMHVSDATNTVSAISDSDYTTLANVSVGKFPSGIAFDSARHEVFVANQNSGTVSVISDDSNSVVATIDLSINSSHAGISNIVYDSGKGEMFVSNFMSGVVSVILDSTREVVATIPLGTNPYPTSLIYNSGKGEIYVRYEGLGGRNPANFMSVISDATNSVIATVPLDNNIAALGACDSATGEIYMPNPANSSVLVISDKTHSVVGSIPVGKSIGVGFDPVKGVLFVGDGIDSTDIVSVKTKSVIDTVPIKSVLMVYDSGKNVMLDLGNGSIQFVSDASLPSVSSNPTPSPTNTVASPTPTVPEFPATLAITFLVITALAVVVVFRRRT
jgi:DNA-binding beta-propeller fold protein YncE